MITGSEYRKGGSHALRLADAMLEVGWLNFATDHAMVSEGMASIGDKGCALFGTSSSRALGRKSLI